MSESVPVIAIDGPGGAGKGTVCREIARELGWHLLDSGSLYRIAALRQDADNDKPLMNFSTATFFIRSVRL